MIDLPINRMRTLSLMVEVIDTVPKLYTLVANLVIDETQSASGFLLDFISLKLTLVLSSLSSPNWLSKSDW